MAVDPTIANLDGIAALPRKNGERVFRLHGRGVPSVWPCAERQKYWALERDPVF